MPATTRRDKQLSEGTHHSRKTPRTFAEKTWSKATGIFTFIIILGVLGFASFVFHHKQHILEREIEELRTEVAQLRDVYNFLKESSYDYEFEGDNDCLNSEADDIFDKEPEETSFRNSTLMNNELENILSVAENLIPSVYTILSQETKLAAPSDEPKKANKGHRNGDQQRDRKTKKGNTNKKNAVNAVEAVHIIPDSHSELMEEMCTTQGEFTFLSCIFMSY